MSDKVTTYERRAADGRYRSTTFAPSSGQWVRGEGTRTATGKVTLDYFRTDPTEEAARAWVDGLKEEPKRERPSHCLGKCVNAPEGSSLFPRTFNMVCQPCALRGIIAGAKGAP